MCGFAGFLGAGVEKLLHQMSDELVHRGPDDSGHWFDAAAQIGISHRRLSIIDLSEAGHQPMLSESGRYVIAFNGEIYNHLSVRKELSLFDCQEISWRGHSDTETLLAGIDTWGLEKTLNKLTGMFAFALWDRRERQLSLVRDRLGEKPLYYGWQREGEHASFLYGSELKAFRVHPSFISEINRDAINLLLRHNCIPAPYSIYKGISKLAAGSILSLSLKNKEPKIRTYWSAKDIASEGVNASHNGSDEEVLNELEVLLSQSIEQQMVADVPLGSFLSGGIDSSLVVALMQKFSDLPVKTFTIGFSENGYNEAEYAKAVAKHLKTDHTEYYLSPKEAMDVIPRLPQLYDEPFSDSSQIPTFLVSKLAHQNVKVSLSGDAGDELFCGYNRYILTKRFWNKLSLLPKSLRCKLAKILINISPSTWSNLFGFLSQGTIGDKIHKAAGVLGSSTVDELYLGMISHWDNPGCIVLNSTNPRTSLTDNMSDLSYMDPVHKMMLLDLMTYLPDDILTKVDRAGMGVSLETRTPFLDHRVVEFAWHIPLSKKIRKGQGKWILRQLLYKYIPKELIERPKMGFGVPIGSWLRGPLREWAENLLDESRLRNEGYLNTEPIRKKWEEHLSGKRNWQYHLWDVLMFQAWLEA